jgi:hypothetical protein
LSSVGVGYCRIREVVDLRYWLGVLGTWIVADGISSLYNYTHGEKSNGQSWIKDHSFRLVRCAVGIAVIIIGATL